MGKTAKKAAVAAKAGKSAASASRLNIIFDGTWFFVPTIDTAGRITSVRVYSPTCGHPHGVTYASGPTPQPWPEPPSFYQLDPHSYAFNVRRSSNRQPGISIKKIDAVINHCVSLRPTGENWDLLVTIPIGPDAWVSGDTVTPKAMDSYGNTVPCFVGTDAPTGKVSSLQTLTFDDVASVEIMGASTSVRALLPAPWNGPGSIIFENEIPYSPSLQHERTAIFALADLAGIDLAMNYPLPKPTGPPRKSRLKRLHTGGVCGHALIAIPT